MSGVKRVAEALSKADRWLNDKVRTYGGRQAYDALYRADQAMDFLSPVQDYSDAIEGAGRLGMGIAGGDWRKAAGGGALMAGGLGMAMLPGSMGGMTRAADDGGSGTVKATQGMGIRAYHGSPHDFDRFSLDKIGTGEGAQAYGHGLYFAENNAVAEAYRDAVGRNPDELRRIAEKHGLEGDAAQLLTEQYVSGFGGKRFDDWLNTLERVVDDPMQSERIKSAARQILDRQVEASDAFAQMKAPGRMYEVNINASPDEFLDWDAPLSEQSEKVQRLVAERGGVPSAPEFVSGAHGDFSLMVPKAMGDKSSVRLARGKNTAMPGEPPNYEVYFLKDHLGNAASKERAEKMIRDEMARRGYEYQPSGEAIYRSLTGMDYWGGNAGVADKTEALRAAGLKGIRYLDQGSRTAKEGTRNFVVFDDSTVEILRKYGLAGLIAGGSGGLPLLQGGLAEERRKREQAGLIPATAY